MKSLPSLNKSYTTVAGEAVTVVERYGELWIGIIERLRFDLAADRFMVWNTSGDVCKYNCTAEICGRFRISDWTVVKVLPATLPESNA